MSVNSINQVQEEKGGDEWYWKLLPPLKVAVKIARSATPLNDVKNEKHGWWWTAAVLLLCMVLAVAVMLAGESAPMIGPFDQLWTFKFKSFLAPDKDWEVLGGCAAYVAGAAVTACAGAVLAGFKLTGKVKGSWVAIRLAGYGALGSVFIFLLALMVAYLAGTGLYVLKVPVFVYQIMVFIPAVVVPVEIWRLSKLFRRTALPGNRTIIPATTVSVSAVFTCALAAIFISAHLNDSMSKHGRAVNSARNTPTSAMVQDCRKNDSDMVCAVTLYPQKWQDYELIGDWALGAVPTPGARDVHSTWHPAKDADHVFALVAIEANKQTTVEVRMPLALTCHAGGTNVKDNDVFFFVRGRVQGEQRSAPLEMRLRVDNSGPRFAEMLQAACLAQPGA